MQILRGLAGQTQGMTNVDPVVGVGAALLALASTFWNIQVAFLMIAVPVLGILDMLVGAHRASVRKRLGMSGGYDRARLDEGIASKVLFFIIAAVLGFVADSLLMLIADFRSEELSGWVDSYTPIMTASLAWRGAREFTSIIQNVEDIPGAEGALLPGLKLFANTVRYKLTGNNPPATYEQGLIRMQDFPEETQSQIRALIDPDTLSKKVAPRE